MRCTSTCCAWRVSCFHTFHYTGKFNDFDVAIEVGNFVAALMAAALFLHFCLTFPERGRAGRGGRRFLCTCRRSP